MFTKLRFAYAVATCRLLQVALLFSRQSVGLSLLPGNGLDGVRHRQWDEIMMKTKTIGLTLVLSLVASAVCLASPHMGNWKLNEAKSKFAPGAAKNHTVVYAAAGDQVKVTVDGKDAEGKSAHNEWTGKFDGKDYPVTGDPASDTRAYKEAGANTLEMTVKKDGKVTATGSIVVSADGKSRTVTTSGTDAKGTKVESAAVYDKG